jgi:hypothetical protein
MGRESKGHLKHCGRVISEEELSDICETVAICSSLSRSELPLTICEQLEWYSESGTLKHDACVKLLEKLEKHGVLKLPEKQASSVRAVKTRNLTSRTDECVPLTGIVGDLGGVRVQPVTGADEIALWNEYMSRYHCLGYKQPFGCSECYFITSAQGKLGCILFSGASNGLRERDKWIGWSKDEHLRKLGLVINNSRFLMFSWVQVKNLASYALGQVVRRLCDNWQQHWNYKPVLVETFVDPEKYAWTCYRAANWLYLGQTTGIALARQGKKYTSRLKQIYVLPLTSDFREHLCTSKETRP